MRGLGDAGLAGECETRVSTENRQVGVDSSKPGLVDPGIDWIVIVTFSTNQTRVWIRHGTESPACMRHPAVENGGVERFGGMSE
jgi:hypothetical protein